MLRLLIAILLLYVVFRLMRFAFQPRLRARKPERTGGALPAEMVACAACGTFVINAEAQRRGSKAYCSDTCAETRS